MNKNIEQNLVTIAENRLKIYEAGGLAYSPKEIVSSEIVAISDISPIEHTMAVKLASINILDTDKFINAEFVKNEDGSYTFTKNDNGAKRYTNFIQFNEPIPPNTSLCFSVDKYESDAMREVGIQLQYTDDTYYSSYTINATTPYKVIKVDKAIKGIRLYISQTIADGTSVILGGIMFRKGNIVKPYTPYVDVSTVKLNALGKNLLSYPYVNKTKTMQGITFTDNGDGSITANGTATGYATFDLSNNFNFVDGVTYAVSGGGDNLFINYLNETGTNIYYNPKNGKPLTWDKRYTLKRVYLQVNPDESKNNEIFYPMIEIGTTATEYEPYIEPVSYTPNADGTVEGVKSIYPSMTLMADTEGVNIEAEYYQDGRKVKENLKDIIVSQGGILTEDGLA